MCKNYLALRFNSFKNCVPCKNTGFWKQETTLKSMKRNFIWKNSRKLESWWVLTIYILHVWNVLRVITNFFGLKSRVFRFLWKFYLYFENLHYLLHLNESEDDVSEAKEVKNDSSVEIRDVSVTWRSVEIRVL